MGCGVESYHFATRLFYSSLVPASIIRFTQFSAGGGVGGGQAGPSAAKWASGFGGNFCKVLSGQWEGLAAKFSGQFGIT